MEGNKIKYISGLKGIACLGVMIGHFSGIAKYITSADFNLSRLTFLSSPPLGVLFNESFWLYLFFLASGFLLANSSIEDLSALVQKIFRRFLRLGIPILFASASIYLLWIFVGMHNFETGALFQNAWYQNAYTSSVSIVDVVLSPIHVLVLGKTVFNSPYWVLRDMFIASILIYLCLYVQSKASKVRWTNHIIAYGFALLAYSFSMVVTACVIGFILAQHRNHIKWFMEKAKVLGIAAMVVFVGVSIVYPTTYSAVLLFSAMILLIPSFPKIERLLSNQLLMRIERISFGIYSFHWPVVCSVGACVLLATWHLDAILSLFLCSVVSVLITILLSYLFSITAERAAGYIVRVMSNIMCTLFNR